MLAWFNGYLLGLSLIISIGVQNLFLIRQGLRRHYAWQCAWVLSLSDTILILAGVAGVAHGLMQYAMLHRILLGLTLLFLCWQSLQAFYRARKRSSPQQLVEDNIKQSRGRLLLAGLGYSFLNPAALAETMIVIGGLVASQPISQQAFYTTGVIMSSFSWFFAVVLLASFFASRLNDKLWQILDWVSGSILLLTAGRLAFQIL